MFRLFGLLLVGLVVVSSISSAKASNLVELGACGFFDGSKSNHNWNIEKKFGPRYFKFYKGKSNFYYSVGTSDYSQSKATELEHKINNAFNEWYFSDKNFRFEINKWSNAIQVKRIGKQNVGPFIGNTGGCGRLISKIKQSYSDSDFSPSAYLSSQSTEQIAKLACSKGQWTKSLQRQNYVKEAKRRGLSCGVEKIDSTTPSFAAGLSSF